MRSARSLSFRLTASFLISASAVFFLLNSRAFSAGLKAGDFVAMGPASAKRIALTFDDGPGPETDKVLDLLDRHGVKGTFFMLAEQVNYRPAVAGKIVEKGHEVASHTFKHVNYLRRYRALAETKGDVAAVEAAQRELIDDMRKSRAIIEQATGRKIHLLRMPHGVDRPWISEAARQTGFVLVNWTYGADWLSTPQEELAKSYVRAIKPGAIFLFHDGGRKREKTLALTEAVILAAKEKGYEIVTAGELLAWPTPRWQRKPINDLQFPTKIPSRSV